MNRIGPGGHPSDEVLLDSVESREPQPTNPLLKIHQLLRRHYVWAILTGVILAAIAVPVVWKLPIIQPKYTSTGLIQIKPALDPLLYQTQFNARLADYDQFLETQVPILRSQRIILQAMDMKKDQLAEMDRPDVDPNQRLKAWDNNVWGDVAKSWGDIDPTEQVARLSEGLQVWHPNGTQVIQISFSDHNPTLASVTVKLVIAAYKKLYDVDVDKFNQRMATLESKEKNLTNSVNSLNDSVKVAVGDYGSEEFLTQALERKQNEFLETDQLLGSGESQVKAMARSAFSHAQDLFAGGHMNEADSALNVVLKVWRDLFPSDNGPDQLHAQIAAKLEPGAVATTMDSPSLVDLTPELAAATDGLMATLLRNRADAQHRMDVAKQRYGEFSEVVRSFNAEVVICQEDIDERLAVLTAQMTATDANGAVSAGMDSSRLTLADATERLKRLRVQHTELGDDTKRLQDQAERVSKLATVFQAAQEELDTVQSTKHKLEFEGISGGRTDVISPGDKPLRPDKDRRIPAAVAAGMGGLALGLGIFTLIGLFDRRLRSIADARETLDGSQRILGILPTLPEDLADPEQVSGVAFAVHHIRTLLQLGGGETRSTTFAITSAAPQDGKTSLTMALGMSYAASGAKTLLIDGDVIGAGLSSRMGIVVRPRLGGILLRQGLITGDQLDAGLTEAQQTGNRIGRVLVKLGFIKPTDKKQALAEQATSNLGFLDMLDGRELSDCTREAGSPNLSLMPVGNISANHVGRISIDAVRRIIAEARSKFDIVLFDTGPLLGSLEAGIVAASVDEVIVAVARGQQVDLLEQTFQRLRELEARVAGIVFNRAHIRDLERSGYTSSMASQRIPSSPPVAANGSAGSNNGSPRLGPIARAMAASSKRLEDQ